MNLSLETCLTLSRVSVFVLAIALVVFAFRMRDAQRNKRIVRAITRLGMARRAAFKAMHSVGGGTTPGGTDAYVVTLLKGSTDDMASAIGLLINELPRKMQDRVVL